jgi:DNA-binding MarR family transcriptional regulator
MSDATDDKGALTGKVWRLLFDYLIATSPQREEALASRGLTPNDSRALMSLDRTEGRPIGSLARQWKCDPSNATFIVDRLEKAGLAERKPSEVDRRIKLVLLTDKGAKTRDAVQSEFRIPPQELGTLPEADLRALEGILTKLRS